MRKIKLFGYAAIIFLSLSLSTPVFASDAVYGPGKSIMAVICVDAKGYKDYVPHYNDQFPPGSTVKIYVEASGKTKRNDTTGEYIPSVQFKMTGTRPTGATFTASASSPSKPINHDKTLYKETYGIISFSISKDAAIGDYRIRIEATDSNKGGERVGKTPYMHFYVYEDATLYPPINYTYSDLNDEVSGVASADTPTLEDLEYIEWATDALDTIGIDSRLIASAAEDYDLEDLELWSSIGYNDAKKLLGEIDKYDVSHELQPAKDELKLALEDFKWSCYYSERGAKYYDADDLETSVRYTESSTKHIQKIPDLLPEITIPSPTPEETPAPVVTPSLTPQVEKDSDGDGVPDKYDYAPNDPNVQTKEDVKTPGFGAIFAIGSLLAVVYLVLRRKNE